jgi:galactitol PTS system EIIC component
MEQVFSYIIGLGAAVMMPIIFTILGVCIGIKFSKALKSGLLVGVGFVGLSVVTALLTSSLGPALSKVVEIYGLQLKVFDMGWPAAAAVAYNTSVGAFIIPVCLAVNILMLLTKTTRTVNIDLWNYWHFAFIGAVVYFATDSILWGFFAAVICYIITLILADYTADKFQGFYDKMEGISIPQPFCAGFVPFALIINKVLDKIPGFEKLNIDAEGMKKKFGLLGEPLFLGILVGCGIGALSCKNGQEIVDKIPYILGLGIKMGAVMELIPRITSLFIEGLKPISDATRELIAKKFKGAVGLNIGMSPALVIGHPATLVVSLLLIPVTILSTRTVNIDLWNYWHFAFIGAVVYFATDSILWGFFAAVICYIITLILADYTADKFQGFYDKMEGISIPQPFCAGFVPFALIINKVLDKIPGFEKLNIDAEGMKKKFGLLGEPLFLGILVGCGIGALSCKNGQEIVDKIPYILGLGIKMGAVMELIPRITSLFIEGLKPISDATRELIAKKFKGAVGLNIGMSPALVIGHPATLVVSLLLIPVTILLAVVLPGNEFLPLASLAGMFYVFPLILPITKGNVVKTFIIGFVVLAIGLYFVTDLAPYFTKAAHDVYAKTQDAAVNIPSGFEGGALDFASSPFSWAIFHLTYSFKWIGSGILVLITLFLMVLNRRSIIKYQKTMKN